MKIHLAIITNSAGYDVIYAGQSVQRAESKVAGWCRDYWRHEDVDLDTKIDDPSAISDRDVIDLFFNSESIIAIEEQYEIIEVELED